MTLFIASLAVSCIGALASVLLIKADNAAKTAGCLIGAVAAVLSFVAVSRPCWAMSRRSTPSCSSRLPISSCCSISVRPVRGAHLGARVCRFDLRSQLL
ncbi:MAG: hypothetical protein ACLRM9_01010 [Collinsella aerofaciens]